MRNEAIGPQRTEAPRSLSEKTNKEINILNKGRMHLNCRALVIALGCVKHFCAYLVQAKVQFLIFLSSKNRM